MSSELDNFDDSDEDWMDMLQDVANESDDDDDLSENLSGLISLMNAPPEKEITHKNSLDILEKVIVVDKLVEHGICPKCNVKGLVRGVSIVCEKCGIEISDHGGENTYNHASSQDHNTTNNSFMSFNVVGKNSYCYQRSFLKTCANYSSYRKNNNKKELYNYNYQYKGNKIPKNAIKSAIELFSTIKQHGYVYRGSGKKGVVGSCLFYACYMLHITKTPREIANIMNIEERFLSQGDRVVQSLNELGIIEIPSILRPLNDYIKQYFSALKIPDKYTQFIIDLINRAERKNIHIKNDSRTTTKAIGAIYLLSCRVSDLKHITKEKIIKECNISKSTFIRYSNMLTDNFKLVKPVFVKHRIPQPNCWRLTGDPTKLTKCKNKCTCVKNNKTQKKKRKTPAKPAKRRIVPKKTLPA